MESEKIKIDRNIVLSSRVRIARNLSDYKFPHLMKLEEIEEMTDRVLDAIKDSKDSYDFHRIIDLENREKKVFVEDHIISPDLMNSKWRGSFLLREDRKVSIMLNEEDHLRIQVILAGFNIDEAWEIGSEIDDFLERQLDYAFHEKYGYLTTCPTNVGTGLRASFMVHLPALTMTNNLKGIAEVLKRIGLTMRGIYGEGSAGIGCLYQISNQTTLGQSEEEILSKLSKIIYQVIAREKETRDLLRVNRGIELEDRILRSYGILKYNKQISSREAMSHLSNVKLGIDMGILQDVSSDDIIGLMARIQPARIQADLNRELGKEERNIERSKLIRDSI